MVPRFFFILPFFRTFLVFFKMWNDLISLSSEGPLHEPFHERGYQWNRQCHLPDYLKYDW